MTGPIETNTYVISLKTDSDTQPCLIIDPSSGCRAVLSYIAQNDYTPEGVCLTHGHFDHIMGIDEVRSAWPSCQVWFHSDERALIQDANFHGSSMIGVSYRYTGPYQLLAEGDTSIGCFTVTVLHIPGHTPGGCALVIGRHCFCGDSLFAGSIGRTDLPLSDGSVFVKNIQEKLLTLPDDTIVYPGHGGRTTIGRERRNNPFLQ
jgi:glyoxylase-like metal-dependent hydrolase (beta-lactamase superfamily II)